MIRELQLKPKFGRTIDRFEAWWNCQMLDRPPVTLRAAAPAGGSTPPPRPQPTLLRDRWMDVQYVVETAVDAISRRVYPGDSFPMFWANLGPEITATLFGCPLEFGAETSWSSPVVHAPEEWNQIINTPPDFSNPYWSTLEAIMRYALDICDHRFVVGMTDLHGNYDILAALRDPQALCEDILDHPELVRQAGRHVADGFVAAFDRQYQLVHQAGFGSTCWTPLYYPGPAYVPSSDFWCMVSPEVARTMILPDILREMQPLERSIFHLDGPQALRHLDMLLALPNLHAVQWVFGAGHGPASAWIDVYRRIRSAGKAVQVLAESPADALAVLAAIGPRGVWLDVGGPEFPSLAAADAFLLEVQRLTRTSYITL
ncbi:MAG: hypothetical protein HKL95_02365 [Phycisphaerae bacterium]|nr:hypothetical protein [Phycisphaerae bacterium]